MRYMDIWTLGHLAFGAWSGYEGWSFGKMLVVHTAWEALEASVGERYFRESMPWAFSPEPWGDRVLDTVAASAGWSLVQDEE